MTFGSLLLGLALLVGVGLFVTRPIFTRDPHRKRRMSERKALLLQKEAVLTEIRALDFDYETGKVSDEEYQQQREAYLEDAAELLKHIDEIDERYLETEKTPLPAEQPQSEFDEIEAAIARRRGMAAKSAPAQKAPLAASSAARGNFCPQCGEAADADDRFCAYCGHQLAEPQHA
ncbi:MAG: zinc ribbon domain-containing protein [Chloroflexota bacterium]|jgi:hypothetical protein